MTGSMSLLAEIERCRAEIARCEADLRDGHTDIDGLLLGLYDWRCELALVEQEFQEREP